MNRRNVLTGLGGLAISGGALFGTGAFTSVTASRSVNVNVIGNAYSSNNNKGVFENLNSTEEQNLASSITNTGVDVLVDTSPSTVSVLDNDGNSVTAADAFPANADTYSQDGDSDDTNGDTITTDHVSLVANDVTIVFGENNGLPPNSTVNYNNLFAFVGNTNNTDLDVRFESAASKTSVLSSVDGTSLNSDTKTGNDPTVSLTGVDKTSTPVDYTSDPSVNKKQASGTVDTGSESSADQTLDIIIE
jgi:hypothetical protein